MNFLPSNHAFGNKAEELDDLNSGRIKPREFFWDKLVLIAVSAIIGIAAVDVVNEYVRGSDVSCFSPIREELAEVQGIYINNYCAGFLPYGAYIPGFMIVHAVLISLPHYLWLNHCGGNFDFFFHLASSLKRLREDGKHVCENLVIVGQLESTFSTYGRNSIFRLYVVKLLVQLLLSLAGIGLTVVFFQNFESSFKCPRDFDNSAMFSPFWPFMTDIECVFVALVLLHTLWWAEICLLGLICFCLFWALIWCFTTHSIELGAKRVARFSFHSGLAPTYYVPPLPIPGCCRTVCHWLFNFLSSLICFTCYDFRIQSDLDFLLMKLYQTDNGLGHVFKEVQIEKEINSLTDDDHRRLHLHGSKQKNPWADDANDRKTDLMDREQDEQNLKWKFIKKSTQKGVYRDFMSLPSMQQLLLSNTMRGAVLGFGQRAPHNKHALSISFGGYGYTTALARIFNRVAFLNFSPNYIMSEEVGTITQYRNFIVSLVFPENILSSQTSDVNKFVENLQRIWIRPDFNSDISETSFIVMGPIPKEKDFNITTVDLLFEHIYGCLEHKAVLLTIHPLEIDCKNVKDNFLSYEPKPHFLPLRQTPPMVIDQPTEWPARSTFQVSQTVPGTEPDNQVYELTDQSDRDMNGSLLVSQLSSDKEQLPFQFDITVQCGETMMRVRFSTYCYNRDENEARPQMFSPTNKKAQPIDQQVATIS